MLVMVKKGIKNALFWYIICRYPFIIATSTSSSQIFILKEVANICLNKLLKIS
jgi:hypothetical protein